MRCLSLALFLMVGCQAVSQTATGPTVLTVKPTSDFEVSGDGSAPAWGASEWISMPFRAGSKKSYNTQFKLLYSEKGIYGLFKCDDKKIVATMKEDFSDLYREDVVELFLWPDESISMYFEYELSPNNVELPIMVPNLNGKFFGWRPWNYEGQRKARHATKITPDQWTAEFFIPYGLLAPLQNVPPAKGTKWRANMYRLDYDEGTSRWSWQLTEGNFHDYKRFGTLVFD